MYYELLEEMVKYANSFNRFNLLKEENQNNFSIGYREFAMGFTIQCSLSVMNKKEPIFLNRFIVDIDKKYEDTPKEILSKIVIKEILNYGLLGNNTFAKTLKRI